MGYNITVDRGNTATKAAIFVNGEIADTVIVVSAEELQQWLEGVAKTRGKAEGAIFCSVGGTDSDPRFEEVMKIAARHSIKLDTRTPMPIKSCYAQPDTLGADRLAAAAGAYSLYGGRKNLLVIDAGTAVTYDVVTPEGDFIGGNIAPGIKMRLDALHAFTSRLPLVDPSGRLSTVGPCFGNTTESAMLAGAIYGIAGESEYYRHRLGADTIAVITGGWGEHLFSHINNNEGNVVYSPHLVTKGLNCILQYNENK